MCARRYAGRLTHRILNTATGKLFAIEMRLPRPPWPTSGASAVAARNFVDHRRRLCRLVAQFFSYTSGWDKAARSEGLEAWARLRSCEVLDAFQSRWPTSMRPLVPDHLKSEIVAIIRPDSLTSAEVSAKYQHIKFAIWPRQTKVRVMPLLEVPIREIGPMPFLL